MGTDSQSWHLDLNHEQWVALPVDGQRPAARYKHAATVYDEKLYVMGGSRNGRYLSDLQVFDLKNLTWSSIKLNMEATDDKSKDDAKLDVFPATSGHSMIKRDGRLILLAGLTKEGGDRVAVRFIDLESYNCGVIETFGNVPVARSGQSVTQFGSKIIMFGGEDRHRGLLNDVHVLDLETMAWSAVETTQTPPSPRFDHAAALHAERYLFIFGGCSHSVFYNDLHVLDLETMEWSRPQLQGDLVAPRAGHAGVAVEENWYIVGGGDNKSGALETLVINMSKLVVSAVTSVKGRDPLASEGISISSASLGSENFLITFGGYNGKYYNEVFALRVKPRDSLHPKILQSPAAAAAAASVSAAYALARPELYGRSPPKPKNRIQIFQIFRKPQISVPPFLAQSSLQSAPIQSSPPLQRSDSAPSSILAADRSAIRSEMSNGDLLQIDPLELQFPFELKKQISCSMQLTNKSSNYVAFKVKTTNPKKYCVRPNTGVVVPHSTCDVIVTMQAQKEAPPDLQCRDKFLLQSAVVSPGSTAKDITAEMFNKDSGNQVDESKLRVSYVPPPQPPSPVREGSEEGSSPRASVSDNGTVNQTSEFNNISKGLLEQQENSAEVKALISRLTEEKRSAIQQNHKLQYELELLRRKSRGGGVPLMYVIIVCLIGIVLGYLLKRT